MSLKEWSGIDGEALGFCAGFLCFGLMIAMMVSSLAWPVAWYNVEAAKVDAEKKREMMERGYEENVVVSGGYSYRVIQKK